MNAYTYLIRHSTVVFTFTIYANTQRNANKQAMQRIATDYPKFKITTCTATIY